MKLDLTKREVTAWVDKQMQNVDSGFFTVRMARRNAEVELQRLEQHDLTGRVPNMVRALRMLIERLADR